jgi:regulator of protease activity HflC (stomatin/prohibitin superfamily)
LLNWFAIPLGLGVLVFLFYSGKGNFLRPAIAGILSLIAVTVGYAVVSIRIVNQGTEALVERLGRYHRKLKPGLNFIFPFLDNVVLRDSVREQILDIVKIGAITRDNVPLDIDAVVYWRILELELTYYAIENVEQGIEELVITTLRSKIGKMKFEETFSSRDEINRALLSQLDEATEPWGVKVTRVEVQEIIPPDEVRRVMLMQHEGELKLRVAILEAQGEYEAARLRRQAAELIIDKELKTSDDEAK